LTTNQLLYLEFCIDKVKAEQEFHKRECDSELSPERMYNLTLELTGDERLAEKRQAWHQLETSK